MAEQKTISTRTTINISGLDIDIFNEYFELALPYTIQSRVSENVGNQEGTSYIEGELLIKMVDEFFPSEIDYFLNEDGTLTVKSESGDVNQYSIDEEGFLIYNELFELTIGALDDFGFESTFPWGTGDINLDRTTKVSSPTNTGTGAARFFMQNYEPFLNSNGDKLDGLTSLVNYLAIDVTNIIQVNKKNVFSIFCKTNGIASGNSDRIAFFLREIGGNETIYSFTSTTQTTSSVILDNLSLGFTTNWNQLVCKIPLATIDPLKKYTLFLATFKSNATSIDLFSDLEIFFDDFSITYENL